MSVETSSQILIVEDCGFFRNCLRRAFKQASFEGVEIVADAETALDVLSHRSVFNLVVTDYHMPGIDGVELVERIKDCHIDLPVVMMTGDQSPDVFVRSIAAGVAAFFEKPDDAEQLAAMVDAIVALANNCCPAPAASNGLSVETAAYV